MTSDARDAFTEAQALVESRLDPVLFEVTRMRMAMLLGHTGAGSVDPKQPRRHLIDDGKVNDLPRWPTSVLYSERERAFLELTEQFVLDVSLIDDAMVSRLLDHADAAEVFAFVQALYVIDQSLRAADAFARLNLDRFRSA